MNLQKIEVDDFESFQGEIEKLRDGISRTTNLTWFYVNARFRLLEKDFQHYHSVDGSNDGGIDCFFREGNTYYLIQSKYHERTQKESISSIKHELQKIEKTLIGKNTNLSASDFVNALKRDVSNTHAYLEIIWLTTNEVPEKTRVEAQSELNSILKKHRWQLNADINFVDYYALESVIHDIKHGYVPHTGKKELQYEEGECMVIDKSKNNIEALVCNVRATDILSWFNSSQDISKYLQKNVRESVGENKINRSIRDSFKNDPSLFWYKHNGIIVFADWLDHEKRNRKITVRNPQIVNGAQTITQLFRAFDEDRKEKNSTKILVRLYRLPYEDSETYKRSIDIIAALNSQNKIKASDLHSTDPRQVMLENRIKELGLKYTYNRKRSDDGRLPSGHQIFMTRAALIYHVCEYKKPDEGISGSIETYFEEEKRYEEAFPENQIKKKLSRGLDHVVFRYIESWRLKYMITKMYGEVTYKQRDLYKLLEWYVLVDVYQQQQVWRDKFFQGTWRDWIDFIESSVYNNAVVKYAKKRFGVYEKMLPKKEVDPRNFYKALEGRRKFIKNSGNFRLFRQLSSKAYILFKKRNR
jgi:hypothetical protein